MFVALGIQYEKRRRFIVICGLPRSTIFSTLSHKRQDFSKKKKNVVERKMCVLSFSSTFAWNTFRSKRTERDTIENFYPTPYDRKRILFFA